MSGSQQPPGGFGGAPVFGSPNQSTFGAAPVFGGLGASSPSSASGAFGASRLFGAGDSTPSSAAAAGGGFARWVNSGGFWVIGGGWVACRMVVRN